MAFKSFPHDQYKKKNTFHFFEENFLIYSENAPSIPPTKPRQGLSSWQYFG